MSMAEAIAVVAAKIVEDIDSIALVDVKKASELMGVSPSTFRRLGIPCIRFGTTQQADTRYRVADIRRYIEQCMKPAKTAKNQGEGQ